MTKRKSMTIKKLALFLACLMLFAALAACTSKDKEPDETPAITDGPAEEDKGVNVYVEGIISSLDPYSSIEYVNWYVWNQIYETLVTVDAETGEIYPALAKEHTISEDGLTYSFVLEEGVKFHNGAEFKASDAVYSLNTAMEKPAMSSWTNMMDKAEATGDYSFDLTLKRQYAALPSMLAQLPIVNEEFYSENDNQYDIACGTGPYMLQEGKVDPNTEITAVRFDDYRKGPAAIPSVTFKVITDASTATIQLETGELDFLMVYSVSNYQPLIDTGNFNSTLVSAPHTAYISINTTVEPLDNKALRQALNYAADKETITLVAYEGLAVPAHMLCNESSFGANFSDATDFSFDLDKAKDKLTEAGFPDGIDFDDYDIELDYIPGSYHEKIAQSLKESWSQAGINVSLRASETYNSDSAAGTYTLVTQGSSFTADMSFMATMYGTDGIDATNYARYSNPKVDDLFAQGDATTDSAERLAIYKEICEIVIDDCPHIPIQHKQMPFVWNKDLNAAVYPSNDHPWYVYEWSWK